MKIINFVRLNDLRLRYIALVWPVLMIAAGSCKHEPIVPNVPKVHECSPDTVYFARDIAPIFATHCNTGCHDEATANEDVVLTTYERVMQTAGIKAGDPEGSDVYEVITETDPDKRMPQPPAEALSSEEIGLIRKWIEQGAQNNTCDYDTNGEDVPCEPVDVSFANDVTAIFQANGCLNCHTSGNNVILADYASVKAVVDNGKLLGAIRHEPGYKSMPQGGSKIDACDITTIETWISEGANDN